ncbi:T-lymphocyte surface antigen Ly-9-like [Triplophysa dalaica]|uniref:T-lymphocyte surface antigen Ly-9-like n=1 Tax=Triplophysa dalaica TaxID=1582913 RepID=UPI0024DF310B|nr:T-lymphocyte surface antigen Ly-9-like [Triplophysa dalaica]
MAHVWLILTFFLKLLFESCGGEKTADSLKLDIPRLTRKYLPCTGNLTCVVMCSVSGVKQAQLSWFNGSTIYTSLNISDSNNKVYIGVDYQDKNNYSCVVSSSGFNQWTNLDIHSLCQSCSGTNLTKVDVNEGQSVTLPANLTNDQDEVLWLYEGNNLIASLTNGSESYHDCKDGRFKNRLQLDITTGSLTIHIIRNIHSGQFNVKIIKSFRVFDCQIYKVTVHPYLPTPIITRNSSKCSTSNISKCDVTCSEVNVTHASLSWYHENSLISITSVFRLNSTNISLCLEVEYQDPNNYSCVANNSFTNSTAQLHINELCKDQHNNLRYLGFLVLLLVPAILCLIYCLRKNCQRDARRGQTAVSITAAQENDTSGGQQQTSGTAAQEDVCASGQGTPGNDATEETSLIIQPPSSQESIPLNTLCCSK